jgi:hypothetical protein
LIGLGWSRDDTIEMMTCPSIVMADESVATTLAADSIQSPGLHNRSTRKPKLKPIVTKLFQEERSPSIVSLVLEIIYKVAELNLIIE